MNKRIKKKHDIERINAPFDVIDKVLAEYDYCYQNGVTKDISYDNWIYTVNGKRCFSSIRKKYNVPKYIGYKRLNIRL